MASSNSEHQQDCKGVNEETTWILVTDHFTGIHHSDFRISKATPVIWRKHFLAQHNPACPDKCVYMDEGGELFNNSEIRNLFTKSGYRVYPTGADASNQNGPVEPGHCSIANTIQALLTGSGIDTKFWPCVFYHSLWLHNAMPTLVYELSPLTFATNIQEDFTNLRSFGCRVWVRPQGMRLEKLIPNSQKGILIGYVQYTTQNILWNDLDTNWIKIATHARFDEG